MFNITIIVTMWPPSEKCSVVVLQLSPKTQKGIRLIAGSKLPFDMCECVLFVLFVSLWSCDGLAICVFHILPGDFPLHWKVSQSKERERLNFCNYNPFCHVYNHTKHYICFVNLLKIQLCACELKATEMEKSTKRTE